ncbi:MAG: hypothetical protein EOP83_03560 [Verrucomicrobiaceae bacterium]|nr:MAG: hypothetical protein EOP83_03560 [Verrucomicrobiaceae bacterium]
MDVEAMAALANKVEDRLQRIAIYEQAKKTKEVEREIAVIEADPNAKIEEILLASYFHGKKSPEKSYALLLKARDVADAGPWRERVEQELVMTGVALVKAQAKDLDLEPARRAALRMRKSVSFNPEMKSQLAGWLKELGMEDESKRYVAGPASGFASRAMRNRYGSYRNNSNNRKSVEDAARLAKDGKREAAARLLLASLRQMTNNPNGSYETERLMSSAKSLKLEKEMVRLGAPGGEASFKRRRDHALLLVSLEQKADAEPLLRKLAEEKPDDVTVKTALYSVLKPEDQLKQATDLAKGDFDDELLATLFTSWTHGNSATKKLDGLEAMTVLLENLAPSFKNDRNLSWVNYCMAYLVSEGSMDVQLTSLFKKEEGASGYDKEKSQRRADLCKRTFRAMLRHPQTAEQGFVLLSGTRDVLGATKEELDAAALSALRLVIRIEQPPMNRRHYSNRRDYLWSWVRPNGSSSGGGAPEGLMPSTWLSQRSAEGKALEPYDKEFLLSLAKEGGDWGKTIETCEAIVAAPGLAKFEEWKKAAAERSQQTNLELEWISRSAAAAKRDDLRAAIEDFMCEALRQGSYDSQALGQQLARSVETAKDSAGRTAALHRLTVKILGPEEAWPLYAEIRNSNVYLQGPNQRLNAFQNLWSAFNGSELMAVSAMRFAAGHGLTSGGSVNWYQILNDSRGRTPAASRLLNAGYFAPGPDAVADAKDGNGKSMLDYGLSRLKQQEGSSKLGEELLKVDGPDRFWARIFGAVLANKPELAYAELDREAAVIGKWSPGQRENLWSFVATWLPEASTKASASIRKQLTENLKQGDTEAKKKAEEYLKDGLPQNIRPYSSDNELQQLVGRLVNGNSDLAAKLWNKCLEHMRTSSSGWSSSSGGFSTPMDSYAHSQLMESLLNQKTSLRNICSFIAAFNKQPSAERLGQADNNFSYYLDQAFQDEGRRREAEIKKMKLPDGLPPNAGHYILLAKETPAELRGILGALVVAQFRNQNSWNYPDGWREKLSTWIGDLKKADPAFANAVKLGILSSSGNRLNDADKADLKASFAAFVAEPRIPSELRFNVLVGILYNRAPDQLDDPACAKAMADFLSSYLTPERQWTNYSSVPAISRFAAWKSISPDNAKRLLAAVEKSRIDYANGGGDTDKARGSLTAINMSLALCAGDAESIAKAARAGVGVRGRLDLAVKLWQGGLGDSAKLLIARPGEFHQGLRAVVLDEKPETQQLPLFSKGIEGALPDWLKGIEDPAQRFRIECLVSCLPDAKEAAAPSVKRSERLASLTQRFDAEAPKPRVSRLESLAALAVEPACVPALEKEIEALIRGIDLGSLVITNANSNQNGSPIDREEQSVMEALLRRRIQSPLEQSGDASRLIKEVESIQIVSGGNNQYYASQQMDRFLDPQVTLLIRRIYELQGNEKKAAAAQALKLCEALLAFDQREMQRDAIALGIMSQLAAGDGSAFDRWLDGLPPETRKRYDEVRKQHSLAQAFPTIHEAPLSDAAYEKPRRELLTAMLTDPATLKREITHPTALSGLLDSKAFTREDIFAVVDALPADHPMKAKFLTEKAGIIGWRSDEKENALKGFDAADAAAKASGDAKSIAYARAYRAKYLEDRQEKPADAAAIARDIKPDDLDEKERKWMEELIKKAESKK